MNDQIKFSTITTLKVTGVCLLSTFIYIIINIAIGDNMGYYFVINPFTSGLIHANFNHILCNMFGIFVSLNARCNRFYTLDKIFWITSLISLIYLPIVLLDQDFASVGISGTCYFLLMRGLGSVQKLKPLSYFFISTILIAGFLKLGENDKISHSVHIIGSLLGLISLYPNGIKFIHKKIYEIIS